jgi:hypothetical protein
MIIRKENKEEFNQMRLIDADELESLIVKQAGELKIKVFDPSVNLILQDIKNAPTIEIKSNNPDKSR